MGIFQTKITLWICITLFLIGLVGFSVPSLAQKGVEKIPAGKGKRNAIAKMLAKGKSGIALKMLAKLQSKSIGSNTPAEKLSGSVFYEEILACGLYPQETRLECIVEVKQRTGFAGLIGAFGSMEHVYFCIDWNGNGNFDATESVGRGIVHMYDESAGATPTWHYSVYRDFDPPGGPRTANLGTVAPTTTNGPTRSARAILSWIQPPTNCNFQPVWGNVIDFRIRFDPIR